MVMQDVNHQLFTDSVEKKENLEMLQVVDNLLQNYASDFKSGVSKCGEKYSMAGDSDFYSMADTANYIVRNCIKLQALEMNRSEDLQEDISNGSFKTYIYITIGVTAVIILVIAIIYAITQSITYPLGLLMSHITEVSET